MVRLEGFIVAGTAAFEALGVGSGVAGAAPAPSAPTVQSTQGVGQDVDPAPSPYASYGESSICATPGLYFVNICA